MVGLKPNRSQVEQFEGIRGNGSGGVQLATVVTQQIKLDGVRVGRVLDK